MSDDDDSKIDYYRTDKDEYKDERDLHKIVWQMPEGFALCFGIVIGCVFVVGVIVGHMLG